ATATTTYRLGGVRFKRDVFASYPDQAIIVRITADQPKKVSFTLQMDSPQTNSRTTTIARDTLALSGQVETNGLRFESRVRVICDGGTLTTNRNAVTVEGANSATLFLVAATSFKNYQDISADPAQRCAKDLVEVSQKRFDDVLAAHLTDYRS